MTHMVARAGSRIQVAQNTKIPLKKKSIWVSCLHACLCTTYMPSVACLCTVYMPGAACLCTVYIPGAVCLCTANMPAAPRGQKKTLSLWNWRYRFILFYF